MVSPILPVVGDKEISLRAIAGKVGTAAKISERTRVTPSILRTFESFILNLLD
jgi:hypothetical protein